MKELTHHKTNGLNSELKIQVLDGRGAGGAHHRYEITGFDTASNPSSLSPEGYHSSFSRLIVMFQNGSIDPESGANGITNEALLAILIDRMEGFCNGPFKSASNNAALHHLHCALAALQERTRNRVDAGIEGTHWILCADEMPSDGDECIIRTPAGELGGTHDSDAGGWFTNCLEFFKDEVVTAWRPEEATMSDTPETDAFMARLWEQYDEGRLSLENLESRMVSKIRDLERDRNKARDSLKSCVSKTLCLERELAELRKDKARLDWLDNTESRDHWAEAISLLNTGVYSREAIDTGMKMGAVI